MNNPLPKMSAATAGSNSAPAGLALAYQRLRERLARACISTPELDARLLVCEAAGIGHEQFVLEPARRLSPSQQARLESLARRRMEGEPVSRIVGERAFWRHAFALGACLDPRPETETLVEAALSLLGNRANQRLSILDLGTGSGCILLSLLGEFGKTWGLGSDVSAEALDVGRRNARLLGMDGRAAFLRTSWCRAIHGRFDLVLANPPYIASGELDGLAPEVIRHDPMIALDGGADGLDAYRDIIPEIPRLLAPDGWALFELGEGQFDQVVPLFQDAGLGRDGPELRCFRDLAGIARCVAVRQPG